MDYLTVSTVTGIPIGLYKRHLKTKYCKIEVSKKIVWLIKNGGYRTITVVGKLFYKVAGD